MILGSRIFVSYLQLVGIVTRPFVKAPARLTLKIITRNLKEVYPKVYVPKQV